jgi:hypothetical protein
MTEDRGQKTVRRCGIAATILLSSVLCLPSFAFAAAQPVSVEASYDLYKEDMKVGQIEETYTRDNGRYTLSSLTTPTGLMAAFRPGKIFINSNGLIGKPGLQPLHFNHQREGATSKDRQAEFDWDAKQLTLINQTQRTTLALPDGTQDRLSAMYQFMFLPLKDVTTLDFPMTNGSKLDHYHYAITRGQKLKTPAGEFKTLYLDNQAKAGESRTEIWLATQRNNLPCKMIITDAGGGQITQVLSKLTIKP